MNTSPLYGLAFDVLAATTRLLGADSVFALARLSGDRALWQKCTTIGGVSELHVEDEKSLKSFLLNCLLLPSFTCLTELNISASTNTIWQAAPFQLLPKTMRVIKLRMWFAFDAWLRPVDEDLDLNSVKYLSNMDGLVPIAMKDLYPNLQTLHLTKEEDGNGSDWTFLSMSYFIRNLPVELLKLSLSWTSWHSVSPGSIFRFTNAYLHLEHFSSLLGSNPVSLRDVICNAPDTWSIEKDGIDGLMDHQLLRFDRLLTLQTGKLKYDESLALLPRLTVLKSLSIDIVDLPSKDSIILLPPNIEQLSIATKKEIDISAVCSAAPLLVYLRIYFQDFRINKKTIIGDLPQSLTYLELSYRNSYISLKLPSAQPLPKSLKYLIAPSCKEPNIDWSRLPNLTELQLQNYDTASKPLPATLKRFSFKHSVPFSQLMRLSGPLELFSTSIRVGMDAKHLIPKSFIITADEILKNVRDALLLQGITLAKDCTGSFDYGVADALLSKQGWPVLKSLSLVSLSSGDSKRFPAGFALPPHLTSLETMRHNLNIYLLSDLPKTLVNLNIGPGNRYLIPSWCLVTRRQMKEHWILEKELKKARQCQNRCPQEYRDIFPEPSEQNTTELEPVEAVDLGDGPFHLMHPNSFATVALLPAFTCHDPRCVFPSSLTSLRLNRPIILRCDSLESERWMIYPMLQMSNLTTLKLMHLVVAVPELNFIDHLPNSLTDFVMEFAYISGKTKVHHPALDVPDNWLPLLKRLRVRGILFPLRSINPRYKQFDALYIGNVIVHASLVQGLAEKFSGLSMNQSTLFHYLLVHLFPSHLRQLGTQFHVEWGEDLAQVLPRSLTSLEVTYVPRPQYNSSFGEFAKYLPRHLTHLSLMHYKGSREPRSEDLPPMLTSLILRIHSTHNLPTYLKRLPSGLRFLDLTLPPKLALSRKIFASLPRALQRLHMYAKGRISSPDVFGDWPWAITHMCLLITAPEGMILPILKRLPLGLVYLQYEPAPGDWAKDTISTADLFMLLRDLFPLIMTFSSSLLHYQVSTVEEDPESFGIISARLSSLAKDEVGWSLSLGSFIERLSHLKRPDIAQAAWTHEATLRRAQATGIPIAMFALSKNEHQATTYFLWTITRDPEVGPALKLALADCGIKITDL